MEFVGMKMHPKKLRSFAISTSKNKKIFAALFMPKQASFDSSLFNDAASHFYECKNR